MIRVLKERGEIMEIKALKVLKVSLVVQELRVLLVHKEMVVKL